MTIGKFGGGGFAEHQCACLATERHAGSVGNGAMTGIDARSVRSRLIGRINHVLEADRYAVEQAGAGRGIGAFRAGDRRFWVELDPSAHLGIPMLDAFKTAAHKGLSAQVAGGDLGRCFDSGQAMRFACHGSFSIRCRRKPYFKRKALYTRGPAIDTARCGGCRAAEFHPALDAPKDRRVPWGTVTE